MFQPLRPRNDPRRCYLGRCHIRLFSPSIQRNDERERPFGTTWLILFGYLAAGEFHEKESASRRGRGDDLIDTGRLPHKLGAPLDHFREV